MKHYTIEEFRQITDELRAENRALRHEVIDLKREIGNLEYACHFVKSCAYEIYMKAAEAVKKEEEEEYTNAED